LTRKGKGLLAAAGPSGLKARLGGSGVEAAQVVLKKKAAARRGRHSPQVPH
jgi:hypothetical protein